MSLEYFGLFFIILNSINFSITCLTQFNTNGDEMHYLNCSPIIWALRRYGSVEDMPMNVRNFIKNSFIPNEEYGNQTIVCCDTAMNITRTFQSVGAEILRNIDNICGDNVFKRVSFGTETTFMTHPWSVLLVYDTPQRFHCGGSLITNRYVLTAAHCVVQDYYTLKSVRLREHNTSSEIDCENDLGGFEHCYGPLLDLGIEKVISHSNYSHVTYANDIALLRMERFVPFERSIRPICLPQFQNQVFDNNFGIIIGWGATEKSQFSVVLLEAEVPLHPLDHCRQVFRRHKFDDTKICGAGQNATATCKGDSGGPLVLRLEGYLENRKLRYLQLGLVSTGVQTCGDARGFPSVFLSIASYRNWIEENIEL